MVLENLEVKHKAFGAGRIASVNGKYILVEFDSVQKTFVYPDIFEKFLTLADGTVSEEILSDIEASNEAKRKIIEKKNEENHRAMTRGIVIPGKEFTVGDQDDEESRFKAGESEEI